MSVEMPKTWMEFWYLIITRSIVPLVAAVATWSILSSIAQNMDTEWFAVAGAAVSVMFAQPLKEWVTKSLRRGLKLDE